MARSNPRRSGCRKPFDVDEIFYGYRPAVQGSAGPSVPQLFVEYTGLLHGLCLEDLDERVKRRIELRDALEPVRDSLYDRAFVSARHA